ncbi:MAG: right-handed parallel beta-helix repeat-containing protein [Dokdonella sp.]
MKRGVAAILVLASSCAHAGACLPAADTVFADDFERLPAHVYFVATGGNDFASGSVDAPWAHVQHAADAMSAGDTACIRGGVYNEVVTMMHSGSADAGPISVQAAPGEAAIIDGSSLAIPNGQWGLLTLVDTSYVTIQGLELRNFATASSADVPIGLYLTGAGSGVRVVGNHIHDIRTSANGCAANAFGLKVDGTRAPASINGLAIVGNEIDHLVLGCSESFSLDGNVENWTIRGNRVHDTNNIGIGAIGFEGVAADPAYDQARDGIISDNTVYAITSFGNPAYGDQYAADGIYVDGGTRIVIERNRIYQVDIGIEMASEHAGRTSDAVIARSNLVYLNNSAGISLGGYDASVGGTDQCGVIGNTLFDNDQAGTGSGELQIQYHATANTIANNIVYAGAQGLLVNAFTGDTAAPAAFDYNLYFSAAGSAGSTWTWLGVDYADFAAWRTASTQEVHGLFAAPVFVDPVAPDLRVVADSPAVGAGDALGAPILGALDVAGDPRVIGFIDIGAYEQ